MGENLGKIRTDEESRDRKIYLLAIAKEENLDRLDPPPTEEEKIAYEKMFREMREVEKKADLEGRSFIWDVPFD